MAHNVIMPALGMAQETGKLLRWLKREGEAVAEGEPIMEIETDKITVEIESPASGTLGGVRVREGDVIPVGQTMAWLLAPGESEPVSPSPRRHQTPPRAEETRRASPVARKVAAEHGVDLSQVKSKGGRIEKADVLAYLDLTPHPGAGARSATAPGWGVRVPASPKARRLAAERGIDLAALKGSGPAGAVLAADVLAAPRPSPTPVETTGRKRSGVVSTGTAWRVMAERMTASWTSVPHFYLMREVMASALAEMRARITPAVEKRSEVKPTYTDLLVKLTAAALRDHPRLNASWAEGDIRLNREINIGLATAVEDGLLVPVIHGADGLSVGEIAARRQDLVMRANEHKLRPADIAGSTFTITNLGMHNVDAFNAILNPPQAAILAVGRIAERVVAVEGQPAVRLTVILTLTCDHRVVDGARAAKFLDDLANLIEEPWGLFA
jgi:pyruvate dehydrogenase E2 component (dihydrolipoamide acetyltransferase)